VWTTNLHKKAHVLCVNTQISITFNIEALTLKNEN